MDLTCIGFGAVFIAAGILFACRLLLPRAWKEMSEEERKKVKLGPLCLNIGLMIMLCGAIVLTRGLWAAFTGKAFIIAMVVWLVLCGADVFFITKSRRYKKTQ